jgi:hypothetical protein
MASITLKATIIDLSIDLKETGHKDVGWIPVAQDRVPSRLM